MSRSESPERAPLAIDADLTLTRDGTDYQLLADADVVTIVAPSMGAAISLLRSLPEDQLDRIGSLLQTTGLTVVVRVGDERVATLDSTPQWQPGGDDGFEIRSVDVHPQAVAVSALRELRRHPVAVLAVALVVLFAVRRLLRRRGDDSDADRE